MQFYSFFQKSLWLSQFLMQNQPYIACYDEVPNYPYITCYIPIRSLTALRYFYNLPIICKVSAQYGLE